MKLTLDAEEYRSARAQFRSFELLLSTVLMMFVVAFAAGGVVGLLVFAAAIGLLVVVARFERRKGAMFEADRVGFRLRGGRMRLWDDYGGMSVRIHEPFGEPARSSVWINLRSGSGFRERRLVTVEGYSYGDRLAQKIIAFEAAVRAANAEEAARFDLGPAPVVAARKDARDRARTRPALVQWWDRMRGRRA